MAAVVLKIPMKPLAIRFSRDMEKIIEMMVMLFLIFISMYHNDQGYYTEAMLCCVFIALVYKYWFSFLLVDIDFPYLMHALNVWA